jgi:hypothetical protein
MLSAGPVTRRSICLAANDESPGLPTVLPSICDYRCWNAPLRLHFFFRRGWSNDPPVVTGQATERRVVSTLPVRSDGAPDEIGMHPPNAGFGTEVAWP